VTGSAGRSFNYREVGATAGRLPAGYDHVQQSRLIGQGEALFDSASRALMHWELHRGSGLSVAATATEATEGAEVVLGFGVGRIRLSVPCRVVYVVQEPSRNGFAYGTLTGHPEAGEELFLVSKDEVEQVTITITAFSRPALWWSRLGRPVGRKVQEAVTRRYLGALG
jgi:uncharacterized protein (UPF0548 family)